jgi:hypothetical protein
MQKLNPINNIMELVMYVKQQFTIKNYGYRAETHSKVPTINIIIILPTLFIFHSNFYGATPNIPTEFPRRICCKW